MAFLFILGQALPAHLVGGCGARAVSRKTPIYFIQWHCSETFLTESSKLCVEKWAAKYSINKPLSWPDTRPLSHDQLFISLQRKARQEVDVRFVKKNLHDRILDQKFD